MEKKIDTLLHQKIIAKEKRRKQINIFSGWVVFLGTILAIMVLIITPVLENINPDLFFLDFLAYVFLVLFTVSIVSVFIYIYALRTENYFAINLMYLESKGIRYDGAILTKGSYDKIKILYSTEVYSDLIDITLDELLECKNFPKSYAQKIDFINSYDQFHSYCVDLITDKIMAEENRIKQKSDEEKLKEMWG